VEGDERDEGGDERQVTLLHGIPQLLYGISARRIGRKRPLLSC